MRHSSCIIISFVFGIYNLIAQSSGEIIGCPRVGLPQAINLEEIKTKIGCPEIAKEMGIQETIVFRVLIDEDGCYVKHLPAHKGHPILIKAIEKYLPEIQFEPTILGTQPIKKWENIPFKMCFSK